MLKNYVGSNLAKIRERAGQTVEALGQSLDVSPDVIRAWESGAEPILPHRLVELGVVLDCDVMDFFVFFPDVRKAPLWLLPDSMESTGRQLATKENSVRPA